MVHTTRTASTARSLPAIPMQRSLCHRVRVACRARRPRMRPLRVTGHLQAIAEHGRMGWQKASGYNWRALVEADIGRWKRVIGHALRSQTDKRQATEVAIAVDILNRMLELGRPSYVRIA